MNKKDLVIGLTKVLSTQQEGRVALERVFSEMTRALRSGQKVVISGFGSFHPYLSRPHKRRNPKTGESVLVPARKKVRFKPSPDLL